MKVTTKEHEACWFTRIWADPAYSTLVRYEILSVHGWADGQPRFQRKGTHFNDHVTTADHGDAEVTIYGEIKWDGCSHNYFTADPGEPAYLHACGRASLVTLGAVFAYLYDEAARLFDEVGQYHEGLD